MRRVGSGRTASAALLKRKDVTNARKECGHKVKMVDDCHIMGLVVRQGHGSSMAVPSLPLIVSEYYTVFSTESASAQGLN